MVRFPKGSVRLARHDDAPREGVWNEMPGGYYRRDGQELIDVLTGGEKVSFDVDTGGIDNPTHVVFTYDLTSDSIFYEVNRDQGRPGSDETMTLTPTTMTNVNKRHLSLLLEREGKYRELSDVDEDVWRQTERALGKLRELM